jgi:formiminotetrahydrofolate cyclodeaminase
MEAMTKRSCEQYLRELAGKAPVPGGGGTAALAGALGVALGNMVGNLTAGKKKYAAVEEDIQRLNRESEALRQELERLVTADAEVFEPLSRAYGLPKSTPEELEHRNRVMAQTLEAACFVPMEIMECCAQAIVLLEEYAEKGSVLAVSDAGCGAALCRSALEAASLNVFINTKAMADRSRAQELNAKAHALLGEYVPRAEAVVRQVSAQLGG